MGSELRKDTPINNPSNPAAEQPVAASPTKPSSMLQSRSAVLAMLFLVTGAVGIPLLWMSPSFSFGERIFWSILTLAYTTALLLIAGGIVWWCYQIIVGT